MIEAVTWRVNRAQDVAAHGKRCPTRHFIIEDGHATTIKSVDRHVQTLAQLSRATHVIGMAVCHQNFANAATTSAFLYNRLQVRGCGIRRIDDQRPILVILV
jgi:hypothetical protein